MAPKTKIERLREAAKTKPKSPAPRPKTKIERLREAAKTKPKSPAPRGTATPNPTAKPTTKPNSKTLASRGKAGISMPNSSRAGINLPRAAVNALPKPIGPTTKGMTPTAKPTAATTAAAKSKLLGKGTVGTAVLGAILNAPEEIRKGARLARDPKGAVSDVVKGLGFTEGFLSQFDKKGGTSKEDNRTNRPGGRGRTTSNATPTRPVTPSGTGSRRGAAPVPGNGRTGRGGTTADAKPTRQGPPVPERLRNAPTPPALPAAVTRTSSGGGGSRSTPRSSAPARSSTPTAPAKPGQKWSDFNPGRGTSKTNNPLMKDMVGRMKDREDKAQASAASKLTNLFNTQYNFSGEKVDGSKVNTKAKINSTTSEYDKKKRRYGS
jgi:hypothetical protein